MVKTRIVYASAILICLIACLAVVRAGKELQRVSTLNQAQNDLHWIGLALQAYDDEHGHYPPPVMQSSVGRGLHSWRSQIEPYLSHVVAPTDRTRSDQQKSRTDPRKPLIRSPYQFLAIVGSDGEWPVAGNRKSDHNLNRSETISVIGVRNSGIEWSESRDAKFSDGRLLEGEVPVDTSRDVFVLFANGTVQYYPDGLNEGVVSHTPPLRHR